MADERLGASFAIDVTNLKAGLAQANRLIKESQSEFKAAAAGMDDWTKSEDGLNAKLKSLNDITDIQQKKVDGLNDQYQDLIRKGVDPTSAQMVKLRTDINNETAALEKNKAETKKVESMLDDLGDEADDAADAVEDVGDAAKESKEGFTVMKGAISDLISKGIQSLVGACKNAIGAVAGLAEETRESRTAFAKLEQSFETAGFSAETAEKTMSKLYGVLGDQDKATEASVLISKMSKNQKDLEKNTRILTGVYAEYGDSIPTEGLAEGMAATAAMGSVQGVLADALEWQGVNLDEFNEKLGAMSSEQERASFVQETLNGIYGESADRYRENNQELIAANDAQLQYTEAMNDLGEKVEPITTSVREGFNGILQKLLELTNNVDFEGLKQKVEDAFDKFTNEILPKIVEGIQWLIDNKDLVIAGVVGIGAAFAAWKAYSIVMSLKKAVEGMTIAQAALNLVLNANPIGIVISLVAGLVAAFVVLWKKCEGFRDFWKGLWEGIQKMFNGFVNGIIKGVNALIRGLNKIKFDVPDWVPAIGGKKLGFNISEIPLLAEGGVVKKATTAVIGENGKEAVLPLENNTGWMDKLADKLADKQKQIVVNQTNNYSQAHSRYEIYKSKQQTVAAVRLAMG